MSFPPKVTPPPTPLFGKIFKTVIESVPRRRYKAGHFMVGDNQNRARKNKGKFRVFATKRTMGMDVLTFFN